MIESVFDFEWLDLVSGDKIDFFMIFLCTMINCPLILNKKKYQKTFVLNFFNFRLKFLRRRKLPYQLFKIAIFLENLPS